MVVQKTCFFLGGNHFRTGLTEAEIGLFYSIKLHIGDDVITGRNGVSYVIGDKKMGVYIRSVEGGLGTAAGEQHGTAYEFYWPKGTTPMIIDPVAYPFDLVPNP